MDLLGPALELQEQSLQAEEVVLPAQHLPALRVQLPIHPAITKPYSPTEMTGLKKLINQRMPFFVGD